MKLKNIFILSLFLFLGFIAGLLALRASIDGIYYYKEPVKSWVNTLKNFGKRGFEKELAAQPCQDSIKLFYTNEVASKIKSFRDSSLKRGYLIDSEKKKFNGFLAYRSDTIQVKFRLKGDYNDHRKSNKWSYKIYAKENSDFKGLHTFSVQSPGTKGGLYEWYFYQFLKREQAIGLHYSYVHFSDADRFQGIYALEESFDFSLLQANNRPKGVLLKLDENILIDPTILSNENKYYSNSDLFLVAKILPFKKKKVYQNEVWSNQFSLAKNLLEGFRTGKLSVSETFILDDVAKVFALVELCGAQHGLMWKNVRFYYNASKKKLELIAYDAASGWSFDDLMLNRWKNDVYYGIYSDAWFRLFFQDEEFVQRYFSYLQRFTKNGYLESFFESVAEYADVFKANLVGDNSFKNNYEAYYYSNRDMIRNKLSLYKKNKQKPVSTYLVEVTYAQQNDKIILYAKNNSFEQIFYKTNSNELLPLVPRGYNQAAFFKRIEVLSTDKIPSEVLFVSEKQDTILVTDISLKSN